MSFSVLDYAKTKMLSGDYSMAASYYGRAKGEGIASCVVDLRYLTKEYIVYPLEYENSITYFELLKELHKLSSLNSDYKDEYVLALNSLVDIKRLFVRALSLFYFSDILVSTYNSVVLKQILEVKNFIKANKREIIEEDIYELSVYIPQYNREKFARELNIVEAYCMNILLSYTAEQHSIYQGKSYSATTVDYGYYYSTTIKASDNYYNYANVKPRMFLLGYEAYYYDLKKEYEEKLNEIGNFDSPKELQKEITYYVMHKGKSVATEKDFNQYAKHFEKEDFSRESWFGSMSKIGKKLNPLLIFNPMDKLTDNNVGSFELQEYFPQKKFLGVCSMLSAGQGWKVDTVRFIMIGLCCIGGLGGLAYLALAVAKKLGIYFGVNVEKP